MKKFSQAISVMLIVAAIAAVTACKKSTTNPVVQQWSLDSTTYHPDKVGTLAPLLYASDSMGLISFKFASLPTSSGIYKVGDPNTGTDQVGIEARNGTDFYGLSGLVTVTVASGKISVEANDVWMLEAPMFEDSVKLSAHLTEQ